MSVVQAFSHQDIDSWNAILLPEVKAKELVFFPLNVAEDNLGGHWYLAVFDAREERVRIYDSDYKPEFLSAATNFCNNLNTYMNTALTLTFMRCNSQGNTIDCGIHVILNAFADYACWKANLFPKEPTHFTADDCKRARKLLQDFLNNAVVNSGRSDTHSNHKYYALVELFVPDGQQPQVFNINYGRNTIGRRKTNTIVLQAVRDPIITKDRHASLVLDGNDLTITDAKVRL